MKISRPLLFKSPTFRRVVRANDKPITSLALVTLMVCLLNTAHAHNNVVVIPMAGDDVPAELTPTMPVANVATSASDYTISANTVIDNITKLEWQRMDDDTLRNWNEAWDYCANLDLDSHDDWRLPAPTELQSIVDYGSASTPLIDQVAFTNTNSSFYWSASGRASSSSSAWNISFNSGIVNSNNKTNNNHVRCVR